MNSFQTVERKMSWRFEATTVTYIFARKRPVENVVGVKNRLCPINLLRSNKLVWPDFGRVSH